MLGWAIYPTPDKDTVTAFDWMINSAEKYGISLKILFAESISIIVAESGIKIYYNEEEQTLPRFVLMRHYDINLSLTLEKCGVRVINTTASMSLSQNKFLTHIVLQKNNIPTPYTIYGEMNYEQYVSRLGSPFVIKAIRGSKGEEVFLVKNRKEFSEYKNKIVSLGGEVIAQRYISTSYGRDIRVWIVGKKVAASVLRHNKNSFKSNIALGGAASCYEIPEEVAQLAMKSCQAVGLELAGVDILFDGNGYTVCEVNGNAGFRAFGMSGTNADIPSEIFNYISGLWKN